MRSGDDVRIQPFEPRHQSEVRALILAGLAERWGDVDSSLNRDLDDIAASYADGRVLIAVRGEEIVGVGAIVPNEGTTVEIKRVSVARGARRSGVAASIVDALVSVARSWGSERVVCETNADWTSAVELYRSRGFTIDGDVTGPFGVETYFTFDLS